MESININIPNHKYTVVLGHGLLRGIVSYLADYTNNKNVLIITDEFFSEGYALEIEKSLNAEGFNSKVYIMGGGKVNKTFNEVLKIYGELEVNDFARDSTLIALGGGVIGDLTGFVASTWYRGMNLIHIPTTLMGMVDSSIGGKVAINYRDTINAVGNYYHPIANFMDINIIDSLSDRDYISGLAEVIKCALIADVHFINYLKKNKDGILSRNKTFLLYCIKRAIEIKVDHIRNDINEQGKRLLLNYGHTLGHAIEMATQTSKGEHFRHGEGVSLGISAIALIAERHLGLPNEIGNKIREMLRLFRLPVNFSASDCGCNRENLIIQCIELILKDKKRKDNQLRFIFVDKLGHSDVFTDIDGSHIRSAFEFVIKD